MTLFSFSDFSLRDWVNDHNLAPNSPLDEYYTWKLLEEIGISEYVLTTQCLMEDDDPQWVTGLSDIC